MARLAHAQKRRGHATALTPLPCHEYSNGRAKRDKNSNNTNASSRVIVMVAVSSVIFALILTGVLKILFLQNRFDAMTLEKAQQHGEFAFGSHGVSELDKS